MSTKQEELVQPLNESSYMQTMDQIWSLYNDDFNYTSLVLDEYIKKNISSREAFISTVSLYTLNKDTIDAVMLINPPENYYEKHNTSIYALTCLEEFLWNMAKYYETQKRIYAIHGRSKFNESVSYYNQVKGT